MKRNDAKPKPLFTDVIKLVPPGEIGAAKIIHDTPSATDRLQGQLHGQPLMQEKYCRLLVRGNVVMTDAEFEKRTNITPILQSKGNSLVAGLGIGLILAGISARSKTVTVVEKEADVIALVARKFPEVNVIHADIYEWKPPGTFDFIYFDIWADICGDDLRDARRLHRRFKPFLNDGGYMESWCRIALRSLRR
jgi:hypothetical protein